jgi:phosphate transport system protein
MSAHLQIDLDDLHRHLLSMCAKVEDLIHRAVAQLSSPSLEDARALTEQDNEIDRWDVEIEDKCLKILALHSQSRSTCAGSQRCSRFPGNWNEWPTWR